MRCRGERRKRPYLLDGCLCDLVNLWLYITILRARCRMRQYALLYWARWRAGGHDLMAISDANIDGGHDDIRSIFIKFLPARRTGLPCSFVIRALSQFGNRVSVRRPPAWQGPYVASICLLCLSRWLLFFPLCLLISRNLLKREHTHNNNYAMKYMVIWSASHTTEAIESRISSVWQTVKQTVRSEKWSVEGYIIDVN